MLKRFIVFPLLVALFPVLSLYSLNSDQFRLGVVWLPLATTLAATAAIWAIAAFVFRSVHRGAMFAALVILLFFSFGHMLNALEGSETHVFGMGPTIVSLLLSGILFVAVTLFILKTPKTAGRLLLVENFAALCLVAVPLTDIAIKQSHRLAFLQPLAGLPVFAQAKAADTDPDIYYIILDGYGRDDILRDLYGYDNSEFTNHLATKGFKIAAKSRSNYGQTAASLASSLNMTYLDRHTAGVKSDSRDRNFFAGMIRESWVWSFLKNRGYAFTIFATSYDMLNMKSVGNFVGPESLTEFEGGVIGMTPLAAAKPQFSAHREYVRYAFAHLGDAPASNAPTFTFAHIAAPHPPFVFDADGGDVTMSERYTMGDGSHIVGPGGITWRQYRDGYVKQLAYVNRCAMKAVDEILARARRPLVIVIQGDHGPGSLLDQEDPGHTYLTERFSILNAYYLPTGGTSDIYDSISPVNTFRVVLNRYFGMSYRLLPDRSYFSTWNQPYRYIPVTEAIDAESPSRAAALISEKGGSDHAN